MLQALQLRDFRLLWAGSLVSSLGSWLLTIAIPAHVLLATGSLRDTGLTLAAEYLPVLILGPVAGVVADWCDRRRLLITASLFCAGAVAMMLLGTSPGRYWVLYLALIAENSGTVLSSPALQAMTPAVVGTGPLLSSANSLTSASGGIVRLVGGPLGAILLAACGIRTLIVADSLSYVMAAIAMALTSRSGSPPRPSPRGRETRGQAASPRPSPWRAGPARPACRAVAAARHGDLPGGQRVAQRPAHPPRDPAPRRWRAHRAPAGLPRGRVPARRTGHPRADRPHPAAEPAGCHPGRHGLRLLPAVQLQIAGHRAARRGHSSARSARCPSSSRRPPCSG